MDEQISAPEQNTISEPKRQSCDKVRKQRSSNHQHSKFKSKFNMEEKWSVVEKSRLLEALKRYDSHSISSIATLVGTKSEEQVEEKIKAYRGIESTKGISDRVDGPGNEKAPIEAWIDLVQEMTKLEPGDYTLFIPKVLGLITRNEKFADSGFSQLKWRNIYQFLTDITEDRMEVQKLSDIESLVLLDMMHSIGDSLLKFDTSEQRRILDFKYNLLNFRSDNPKKEEKQINVLRIAQALSNDFWDFDEDLQGISSVKTSSSVSSLTMDEALSQQHGENSSDRRRVTETNDQSTASTSNITQRSSAQTASSMSPHMVPGSSGQATNNVGDGQQCSTEQTINQNIHDENGFNDNNSDNKGEASSGVELLGSHPFGKRFMRPKYFTLNPLCVPTQLLAFKPKSNTQ